MPRRRRPTGRCWCCRSRPGRGASSPAAHKQAQQCAGHKALPPVLLPGAFIGVPPVAGLIAQARSTVSIIPDRNGPPTRPPTTPPTTVSSADPAIMPKTASAVPGRKPSTQRMPDLYSGHRSRPSSSKKRAMPTLRPWIGVSFVSFDMTRFPFSADFSAKVLTAVSREVLLSFVTKRKKQRKVPLLRCSGPRLRGCTPLRTPKRRSRDPWAKRKQYYFSFLTPMVPLRFEIRVFPRTPAVFNGCYVGAAYMPPATYRGNPSTGNHRTLRRGGLRPPLPLSSTTRSRQSVEGS